jgi:large subunit ribosomal protein L25
VRGSSRKENMEAIIIKAEKREVIGKQVKALRRSGLLPAIIYGKNLESLPISLDAHTSSLVLPGISSSHLITVEVDGQPHATLVKDKQRNPLTGDYIHVDFLEVSLTEKLQTDVQIDLVGESPAVTNYDGVIVVNLESVEVEALPTNLPERIYVDIKVLKEIGDVILVRDLPAIADVEILTDLDEIIAVVTAQDLELEEEVEVEEEYASDEPEVIERGRKEEEEDY